MKEKDKNIDVFEEATKETLKTVKETVERSITFTVKDDPTEVIIEEEGKKDLKKAWDTLKEDLDGKHAKRFNDVLSKLPDREFIRVYLKALDFAKPKVVREKGGIKTGGDTNVLNINVNYGNQQLLGNGDKSSGEK